MRRLPLMAATAALIAGLIGVADSATAAKPPKFTTQSVLVETNPETNRCVITLDWDVTDPAAVEGYLVQANNTPLKGQNIVQGNVITESTSLWEIDRDTAFYMKVTVILVGGKSSKTWSVEAASWNCP